MKAPFERSMSEIIALDTEFDEDLVHDPMRLLPGVMPSNQGAVAGINGHLFIGKGSNGWENHFLGQVTIEDSWFENWARVLAARQAEAERRGTPLWNYVIPEKQAVLSELRWPQGAPSKGVRPLVQLMDRTQPEARLIYAEPALSAAKARGPVYHRRNSHWNASGCLAATKELAREIGADADFQSLAFRYEVVSGVQDLVRHFFEDPPEETFGALRPSGAVIFENRLFDDGQTQYRGQSWCVRNPKASDGRRIIVFGDSYTYAEGLGHALSAIFAEVVFIWSKDVMWEQVEKHVSHLVLWQSAERFVTTVPAT